MKTSHAIIGVGAIATLAYLIWKNQNRTDASILPAPQQATDTKVASTIPVVMPKPKELIFVPIISEPGVEKPASIVTVTSIPEAKPVYVPPVDSEKPAFVTPSKSYKQAM